MVVPIPTPVEFILTLSLPPVIKDRLLADALPNPVSLSPLKVKTGFVELAAAKSNNQLLAVLEYS